VSSILNFLTGHAAEFFAATTLVAGVLAAWLLRRNEELRMRLQRARDLAEEAARSAALAAPGGVDPEIVIQLLRSGQSPTLEAVRDLMALEEKGHGPRRRQASVSR
jgi:hypothetical protein